MERVTNVNRVATANALAATLDLLLRIAGLAIQSHRAYESWRKGGRGYLQREVAAKAGVSKAVVSQLERGVNVPSDAVLRRILHVCGFRLQGQSAGSALFQVLRILRQHGSALRTLAKETPH